MVIFSSFAVFNVNVPTDVAVVSIDVVVGNEIVAVVVNNIDVLDSVAIVDNFVFVDNLVVGVATYVAAIDIVVVDNFISFDVIMNVVIAIDAAVDVQSTSLFCSKPKISLERLPSTKKA